MVATRPIPAFGCCPRCAAALMLSDEPFCRICGWADYSYRAQPVWAPARSHSRRVMSHNVPYVGPQLRWRKTKVTIQDVATLGYADGIKINPLCPHCNLSMERRFGGMRGQTKRSYECPGLHRIFLTGPIGEEHGWY